MESVAAPLFDQMEESGTLPIKGTECWKLLILWTVVQVQRTDQMALPINQFSQEMVRKVATQLEATGQLPKGPHGLSVKAITVNVDPKWGRQHAVAAAYEISSTAEDLCARLLCSQNGRVILPDTGAVRFNLIAEEGGLPWGWASIGSGALLPISNKTAVVIFDPMAYSWMEDNMDLLKVLDEVEEVELAETVLLRSSNRIVFNTDPDWIVKVDTDLHVKCGESGIPSIVIPGLRPHARLVDAARNTQSRFYGPPPRPTAKLG